MSEKEVYLIHTEVSNGYTCGCCGQTWDDVEIYDDLEKAQKRVHRINVFGRQSEYEAFKVHGF